MNWQNHSHCLLILNINFRSNNYLITVASGGGNAGKIPPEIGKVVVEILCYLPEVYTFGAESEIQ